MMQFRTFPITLLLCALIFTHLTITGWIHHGRAASNAQWEYKITSIRFTHLGPTDDPERTLNQLGRDGWELVQTITDAEKYGDSGFSCSSEQNSAYAKTA